MRSKYDGLDKATQEDVKDLLFVESYRRVKIYKVKSEGERESYTIISRGFLVDEQIISIEWAKQVIDHFHEE